MAPAKGQTHVMALIRKLLPFQRERRGTSIAAALDYLGKVQKRQAIVFLISDFYDQGYLHKLQSLSCKHDLITLQLYDKREESLPSVGLVDLRDPETGSITTVDTGLKKVRLEWNRRQNKRKTELKRAHMKAGADHTALDISGDWSGQLSRFFLQRQARRQH